MRECNHTQEKAIEQLFALYTRIKNVWAPKILAGMKQSSEKNMVLKTVLIVCPSVAILILYMILLHVISNHENDEWISFCNWSPIFFSGHWQTLSSLEFTFTSLICTCCMLFQTLIKEEKEPIMTWLVIYWKAF